MPASKGREKLAAITPPTSERARLKAIKQAYGGKFLETKVHEVMRDLDYVVEAGREVENMDPLVNAETQEKVKSILDANAAFFWERIRERDASFFRDLAKCLEAFPKNAGERPAADPVLFALFRAPELIRGDVYTISQLQEYLLREWALKPDRAEVQRKAKIAGLRMDSRPGRRRGT